MTPFWPWGSKYRGTIPANTHNSMITISDEKTLDILDEGSGYRRMSDEV
jgi:hypothetical protein